MSQGYNEANKHRENSLYNGCKNALFLPRFDMQARRDTKTKRFSNLELIPVYHCENCGYSIPQAWFK